MTAPNDQLKQAADAGATLRLAIAICAFPPKARASALAVATRGLREKARRRSSNIGDQNWLDDRTSELFEMVQAIERSQ